MTILKAAVKEGIKIPTLCNHELLEPFGGCRLCVVEVERMPKLMNACSLKAADGMVVRTESEEISQVRRSILEFLLINHPLDCGICDKAGECELQDNVMRYGPPSGRFTEEKRKVPESHEDPLFARNMERCIACSRCVRMCEEVQGASAIAMVNRGGKTAVEPFSSKSFDCEYCGNCLFSCPVGSILGRQYIYSYRPWQMDSETETVCGYCGVGCSFIIQVRDESIMRVVPKVGLGLNNGLLCSKGMFGYDVTGHEERLRVPLLRKKGVLEESTWDEAIGYVAKRLLEIKDSSGGISIAGIASSRCTNEDNYMFQKLIRIACGSNNIDSISRTGYAAAQKYFEDLLGQGITANIISGVKRSDTVLVIGGDPTSVNPILGLSIRAASRNGASVALIGHAPGLERFKTVGVEPSVFGEACLLEELLVETYRVRGARSEDKVIDRMISRLAEENPEKTGIQGADDLKKIILNGDSVSIVLGMDLVQRTDGHRSLFAIAGLTHLLEARLYLLSERPNEQGLIDSGCVPDMLPGGRLLQVEDFRRRYEDAWGGPVPETEGLTLMEIIEAAQKRDVRALYVMGDNPVFNLPDSSFVREALGSLDLLVVQDIFMTETAELADVVLPALGWAEKEGTYTNLERRIQLLRGAVNVPYGMDDWRIITKVASAMGYEMLYRDAETIMREISDVSPLHRGMTYEDIAGGDNIWPYHGEPLRGELKETPAVDRECKDYGSDLYLWPERPLFHSGSLSQRSTALNRISPGPVLIMGPHHAERLSLSGGEAVSVTTSRGSLDVKVAIEKSLRGNTVLLSNNYRGRGVCELLCYNLDRMTKAPGIEGCRVTIKKVET
jgi:predicted molibdopterin-dependent oxidoreductase YjgC